MRLQLLLMVANLLVVLLMLLVFRLPTRPAR
jgi:hypothetical protein